MKHILNILLIIFVFAGVAVSQVTTSDLLKFNPDTGYVALGEAGVANTGSPMSLVTSPGLLSYLVKPSVSLSYVQWVEGINYNYVSIGCPSEIGNFAVSLIYLSYGIIQGYTASQDKYEIPQSYAREFLVTYAILPKGEFTAGINLKYIQSNLAQYTAETGSLDISGAYKPGKIAGLTLGVSGKNLAGELKYNRQSEQLPQSVVIGAGYSNPGFKKVTGYFDYEHALNSKYKYWSLGVEYKFNDMIDFRAGYRKSAEGEVLTDGIRTGFGLNLEWIKINYAYVPFSEYANNGTHQFGLEYMFLK